MRPLLSFKLGDRRTPSAADTLTSIEFIFGSDGTLRVGRVGFPDRGLLKLMARLDEAVREGFRSTTSFIDSSWRRVGTSTPTGARLGESSSG